MISQRTEDDALRRRIAALPAEMRAAFEQRLGQALPPRGDPAPAPPTDAFLPFPLTDVQQAYWAGRTGDFDLGSVSTHAYVEIEGCDLDIDRLERAWQALIDRHPMLRAMISGDGTQRVLAEVPPYCIARDDLRALPLDVADAILSSTRDRMSHQVLPLDRWPLFEIHASLIDQHRMRLHLSFDSMTVDLDSRARLLREWGTVYRDPDALLPALSGSFRDAIVKTPIDEPARVRARDYWLARLDTLPTAPNLPQRETQPKPVRFSRRTGRLDPVAWDRLSQIARDGGLSINALLLAAYADVLALWHDGGAFTLNLTLFNRPPGTEGIVGNFTGLSLLEVGARGAQRFGDRARQIQEQLWRDIDHRQFGGVAVIREMLRGGMDPAGAMMPVVFTSAVTADATAQNELDWIGEEVFSVSQTPQVWIDLMVRNTAAGLRYDWNSVDAVFPDGMMDDMFAAFGKLIEALASGALPLSASWNGIAKHLLPPEAARVATDANATQGPFSERLLQELWRDHVVRAPDHPALIDATGTTTYRELARHAAAVARHIVEAGSPPLVAVVMPKGREQVAAVIGVLETGAAYLPIDPGWPTARIAQILTRSNATLALTQRGLPVSSWADAVRVIEVGDDLDTDLPTTRVPQGSPDDLAYVIYTSGSSGEPKGVAIDHRGAVNTILDINHRFGVGPSDRVLAQSALSFDLSVYDIFGTLAAGATIVVPDADQSADPAALARLIDLHGVTLWNSVPAMMEMLVDHAAGSSGPRFDSLRHVLLSGDRISPALPAQIRRIAPAARITSLGGATEASIWSIFHPIDPGAVGTNIPYGRPLANQQFRVVDSQMADRPIWVAGELWIGGAGLARGYLGDPEQTAARFVVGSDGARWYRTGDRGRYLPDGTIEFLGRSDDQVKVNGFRIELGEIERVASQHPAVRAVAVVAHGAGPLDRKLVCYVVPAGASSGAASLRDHLRELLPAYMVPALFSPLAALPLTPNGKVDRKRLAAMNPTDSSPQPDPQEETQPDGDRIMTVIAGVVAEIAGGARPVPDANLLDFGITSLQAIRVVNAIEERFGSRPNVRAFYTTPTVRWLAAQVGATGLSPNLSGVIRDPAARNAFKNARHGRRQTAGDSAVVPLVGTLPEPLRDLFDARRSVRQFALRPLPLASLAALLDALAQRGAWRRYGSAGDAYAVQTYLFAKPGRIVGLPGGAYYHDAEALALRPLNTDAPLTTAAVDPLTGAPVLAEAAFAIALVVELRAIKPLYGDRSLAFAGIEAGLMTSLLEIAAPSCGLALCQIGSADEATLAKVFALGPSHRLLHMVVGGIPDASADAPAGLDENLRVKRLIDRVAALTDVEAVALRAASEPATEGGK
ncbi:amino acid adenylation domain-containing protein [Sphingomonas sp. MMS24-J45]|uniref:non-ribosomal peptide synthetase n=1 Tax=Sphingomonas sp. MMS24-J45 TaxID=3238806 RepID=UPI00384F17B8